MSKEKPVKSYLYVCDGDLMQCEEYEWGHVNTYVGKVSIFNSWETQAMEKTATNLQTSRTAMVEDRNSRSIRAEAKHGQ